jgi:dipeptidyl aminopeptidase/acylaminoacyl peptidase
VSRDGKRLAFSRTDGNDTSIWVYDFDGTGLPRRLTFGGSDRFPIWSGDSQWVIFQSNREGDVSIHRQRADGSGAVERLTHAPQGATDVPHTAAPDGRVVLFNRSTGTPTGQTTLMAYSIAERTSAPYPGIAPGYIAGAEFSPDGKWLVYAKADTGSIFSFIPFVEPFPPTGTKHQIATPREGGHSPVWSADGRVVYYTPGPGSVLQAISITTAPSFSFSRTEPVARPFSNMPPATGRSFDVGPLKSGGRMLGMIPDFIADPTVPNRDEIRVVLNWTEELKARVP